jgi:chitinase
VLQYIATPNSQKTEEIEGYPLLLKAIKDAIGTEKELSIAVPGLERDMIAFTKDKVPQISSIVDVVNVNAPTSLKRQ